jgi:FkbM family methyltransferase
MDLRGLAWRIGGSRRTVRAALKGAEARGEAITAEDVAWAYRLFLDRPPESEAVMREKLMAWRSTRDLRSDLLASQEFRLRNPEHGFTNAGSVVIKELEDGLRLFVDLSDHVIGGAIIRGYFETSEAEFVRRTVRPGQTVVDMGANIGFFTVLLGSLVGPTGRVVAFEPHPRNAELLARSIAENGFGDRVVIERAAVGDRTGTAELVVLDNPFNGGGFYLDAAGRGAPAGHRLEEVRVVALDEYPLPGPVGFVKIDVEGAEPLALRGAARLLERDRPVILSEIHPGQLATVAGCRAEELVAEVEGYGYECRLLCDGAPGERAIPGDDAIRSVVFLPKG